jgi:hypothetical protein
MGFKKLAALLIITLAAFGVFYFDDSLQPPLTSNKPKSFLDEFDRPVLLSHRGSR